MTEAEVTAFQQDAENDDFSWGLGSDFDSSDDSDSSSDTSGS